MDESPAEDASPTPIAAIPVIPATDLPPTLHYASTPDAARRASGVGTTVGVYSNDVEAAMHLAVLEAEGIIGHMLNGNVNTLGPYSGGVRVELQVHADDAARAKEILETSPDDLEPADDTANAQPVFDEDGKPVPLEVAGEYSGARQLRDAHAVLASANIRAFMPRLVKRQADAPQETRQFLLRVASDDAVRARTILAEAAKDDRDSDEPRCPRCQSWRVYPAGNFWQSFWAFWGIGKWPPKQTECLACRYRGAPDEFERTPI